MGLSLDYINDLDVDKDVLSLKGWIEYVSLGY